MPQNGLGGIQARLGARQRIAVNTTNLKGPGREQTATRWAQYL